MYRVWARVYQPPIPGQGHSDAPDEVRPYVWVPITTDPDGDNSTVYLVNLIQVLLLCLGESPFYANYGIPAQPVVVQQFYPDIYMQLIQQQFAPYFANLLIVRVPDTKPHYRITATTLAGDTVSQEVAI